VSWQNTTVTACKTQSPIQIIIVDILIALTVDNYYDHNSIVIIMNSAVGDPTDPKGTLRPNLPPEPATGVKFQPLKCSSFDHQINLPPSIDSHDAFSIWSLFFTTEQLQIIVDNTNKHQPAPAEARGPHARKWTNISVAELYAYLAILITMGLHPENDIKNYWSRRPEMPVYTLVHRAMGGDRWEDISHAFHLSSPASGKSVFEKARLDSNFS
jgi:hypothetical protein